MTSDPLDPIEATNSQHPGIDRWNAQINAIAPRFSVPPNLLKAHVLYESGGDANVISFDKGCGLCQITSGVEWQNGKPFYQGVNILDPNWNLEVACRYFIAPNLAAFPGNLNAAIAAYNAGAGAVQEALSAGRDPSLVTYSPQYVSNVYGAYKWLCDQSHKELHK